MDLRSLVETAPDLIGVLDHDQRYVYVNEALERAAGADGAGLIGARADAAMAPEDARRWREALGDVLRSGRGRAIECTMGTVAGPRWFAVRLTPLPEDRACAVWRDITEVRSWQLLDVAVQAMVTGMVIAEAPSGRISFMNTASDRVFGMPSRKVHDMEDYDAVPAFDRRGRQLTNEDWPISRALAGEVMVGERVEIHGHDGTRRTVSINASPVRDRDGAIIAAVATYHDATEASRAEEAARYLAAAGALLERFDPGSSLQAIVDLAVPVLADCCLIHLETAGHPAIAAVAHTDPAKAAAARAELAAQPQLSPDTALARVLAGGPCELVTVDEAVLEQAARDPAHLARLRDQGYRSAVVAPLAGRDGVLGAVTFVMAESGRCYGEADLGVLAELARRTGIALENARLFAAEQRARRHAEEARDRTRRLQALTAALSSAVEEQRVVSIMVNAGRDALGASGGFAWLLRDDDMLELAAAELTGTLRRLEELRTFPITARLPMCDVIRTTRPMMFENLAALADGYPDAIQPGTPAFRSWAVIPFVVAGRGAGAVAFSFAQERAFTDEDRELLVAMSGQASLALERARLYEALHAREEQLRSALTAAHAATWKLDLATMTHKRDASYRALVGVQGERSTATFEGIHPDDRAAVQAQLERTVRDGVPYEPELRIRRDDGTYLWVRSHGRVIHGPDGKPSALAGVIVDIDEAKRTSLRAEEDRRINETLHRLGSSFASELDHDRLVRLITGEVAKLVGAELGAFVPSASGGDGAALHEIRSDVTERFRDADHPLAMPMLHASAAHAPRRVDDATRDPRFGAGGAGGPPPEGQPVVRSYLSVPVAARSGELFGSLRFGHAEAGRFTAAHERLAASIAGQAAVALENARLYQTVREQKDQLELAVERTRLADRRKDEFLAMLGHELRNPLAPIATALELMELKSPGVLQRERDVIHRQVDHLTRLIDDLLDVSRITRGKVQLARRVLELGDVLAKAIEMANPLLEKRMQQLVIDVPHDGLAVDADSTRLAQVFQNLLTNAAKYSEPRSRIELRARGEADRIVIEVSDQGIGIPADVLPRLFDLFVQGDRALDRSEGGLGIGLTIAKSLCELHGGTLEAASAGSGRGSTFTVTLPRAAGAGAPPPAGAGAPSPAGADAPPPAHAAARVRVLVVDDNVDAAMTLRDLLAGLGYESEVAYDGAAALELASSFRPDVAVLDIGLPVMDGYELARKLRERHGHDQLRLIAVTGYGQDADRARAREAGFDHHLIKPIALDALLALLALR